MTGLKRVVLRDVLDQFNAQLVRLFGHGLAVLGGKGAGIIRLGELVGRDEVLVELLLEGGEFIGDVGLGLSLQRRAGDLLGVGDVAAETLKREIIGILPVARIGLEAGNALPVALGILRPARTVGAEGVGLFSRKLRGRGADLITLVHTVDQHGIVRDKHVVGHVADADPAHGRGLDRTILEELEDLDLLVAGLADGGKLVVAEHIVLVELAVGLDVGVERDELVARVKVGDGEFRVVSHERVAVVLVSSVQVVQAVDHALVHLLADAGVRRTEVDDVLCLVADERAGLLRHRDQVLGGDDVLIVQIDAADDGHVGFKKDHVVVELDGDILRAAAIFNVPDLVLVADEHAGGGHAAVILVDVEQQLHALARRRGLGQDDGRDVGLFNADAIALVRFRPFGVAVRVGFRHLFVAVERFGRGDGHALFVRAELGVGVVVGLFAALGADTVIVDIVRKIGETVAVVGEIPLERSVFRAADVVVALLPLAALADEPELVVVRAVVLRAGDEGRAFFDEVAADVDRRAGGGADGRRGKGRGRHQTGAEKLFEYASFHVLFPPKIFSVRTNAALSAKSMYSPVYFITLP